MFNEDAKKKKKKKGMLHVHCFMYIRGDDAKITTDTKSLDSPMLIMYLMVML